MASDGHSSSDSSSDGSDDVSSDEAAGVGRRLGVAQLVHHISDITVSSKIEWKLRYMNEKLIP